MSLELAAKLRERGYAVEAITSSWGDGKFAERMAALGIPTRRMRLGFLSATLKFSQLRMTATQLMYLPNLWLAYARFVRERKPGVIVHTNWHHLLLLLPFLRPDRDIFWLHEVIPRNGKYRSIFGGLHRRISRVIAVSHAVRRSIVDAGVPEEKVKVVHNGITDFSNGPIATIPSGHLRIGIAGQITPAKGHEDLLEAFATVHSKHPESELHIFGHNTGEFTDHLRKRAIGLGLGDKVVRHDFVSNRCDIYRNMDICVVPSRFEDALPTVAIEAAMFGVPTIGTAIGGLPEIIDDGVTGLLVPPEDPQTLAEALEKLVTNEDLRTTLGRQAQVVSTKRFSSDRFVTEFAAALENC